DSRLALLTGPADEASDHAQVWDWRAGRSLTPFVPLHATDDGRFRFGDELVSFRTEGRHLLTLGRFSDRKEARLWDWVVPGPAPPGNWRRRSRGRPSPPTAGGCS